MAVRSIRAFHEGVAYTTQTFDERRGFNIARLLTVVMVATLVVGAAAGAVMLSPLSNNARGLAFHSSVVDRGSLVTLAPGAVTSVTLRFRNSGFTAWERGVAGSQVDLGVKDDSLEFARAGLAIGWLSDNRIASTAEPVVPPGAIGTFTFAVRAPALGVYRMPVQLVVDDVTWLDDQQVFVVVASDFGFHGELVDQSRHPVLRVGETSAPITVKLRNTGVRAWVRGTAGEQVNLGLTGEDRMLSGVGWPSADRVAIQSEQRVEPGDVATFAFRVRAPATPGTYPLRLRPVVDGVTWLEDAGLMSLITVTAASGQQTSQVPQTANATFASSASVTPATVAAGDAASISAAFTSSTASIALVGVEVYTPDGTALAFQTWSDPESFAAGESRSYPATWQVPSSAAVGTYTVTLRAFAPGWTKQLSSQDVATFAVSAPIASAPSATTQPTAASVGVAAGTTGGDSGNAASANGNGNANKKTPAPTAAPSFTTSATAAPGTVAPNGSVSVNATFTSATATTAALTVSIYAPGAALPAHQQSWSGQGFGAGQQRSYPITWAIPADAVAGTYRVSLGVYSTDRATEYKWSDAAATFTVAAPAPSPTAVPTTVPTPSATATAPTATPTPAPTAAPTPSLPTFTQSATVTPTSVTTGGAVSITASFTSSVASTAIVSVYVFAPGGLTQLNQQYFENQVFAAGQTRTYTVTWQVPTTAAPGAYVLKLGTFPTGWSGRHYSWTDPAGTFAVAAPAVTPAPTPTPTPTPTATPAPTLVPTATVPTFTQTATVTPTSLTAGATVTITGRFTAAIASSAIVSLYVFAPGGTTQLNQQFFENQIFAAGQTRTYTVTWLVPSTAAAGTYVIKLGTFPLGWSGRHYSWTDPAATFTVTATSATPAPTVAPTPAPTSTPTPNPTTPPSFSGLHVQGNRIVNGAGQPVMLRGVNRMGMEYSCVQGKGQMDGPLTQASVDAYKSWGINVVRVPLNEHCWVGVEGSPSGAAYQQGVETYVNLLVANGIYAMLDLQWSAPAGQSANELDGMPNTSYSRSFWSSVASRFKNNPSVLFDLFNEPRPNRAVNDATDDAARRQWECWRDGGAACEATQDTSRPGGSLTGAQTVGMQALVDAVRATGAQNVIVLSGIQWANTIWSSSSRNVLTYKPNDPVGQLVASVHIYDNTWCRDVACYEREIAPVAAQMPVVIGEFGHRGGDVAFLNTLMQWGDAHGVGYLAWTWALGDSSGFSQLMLVTNYNGTPNQYGQVLKSRLAQLGLVP
jgi:endoglucanase